jgi:hypothetical protein
MSVDELFMPSYSRCLKRVSYLCSVEFNTMNASHSSLVLAYSCLLFACSDCNTHIKLCFALFNPFTFYRYFQDKKFDEKSTKPEILRRHASKHKVSIMTVENFLVYCCSLHIFIQDYSIVEAFEISCMSAILYEFSENFGSYGITFPFHMCCALLVQNLLN